MQSLRRVPNLSIRYRVQLFLNGNCRSNDFATEVVNAFTKYPHPIKNLSVDVVERQKPGKIPCVNAAMTGLGADGLVVLDDDILVPPQAFPEICDFLFEPRQHLQALCFTKAPIYPAGFETSFAADINFLLHPSVQRILVKMGFFASFRPTGSLYAIHRLHLEPFPDPCNEADVLSTRRIKLSCHLVRTWYPTTFGQEVARRTTHLRATNISGHRNKSLESVAAYERIGDALMSMGLPTHIRHRLFAALKTMRLVMVAAEREAFDALHS